MFSGPPSKPLISTRRDDLLGFPIDEPPPAMLSVGSRCTRLLKIKKDLEDQNTIDRIQDILMPREFTRVDGIVDLVFRTAKEIKQDEIEAFEDGEAGPKKKFTPVHFMMVATLVFRFT